MADIELVIKIPEEIYQEAVKSGYSHLYDEVVANAVADGTILPKGHGRLGDLGKIQSMARKKAEDCFPEGRYDYGYRKALFDFAKDIDDAPTIIAADKTERR